MVESPRHSDLAGILYLYRAVAAIPGGLARTVEEITPEYAGHFLSRSLAAGVILIARHPESRTIVGEIHAWVPEPRVFSHVLGDLTIAIHPDVQGRGIGRQLVEGLLAVVVHQRPEIRRVELIARESNRKAIDLYRNLGFVEEGRLVDRIQGDGGGFEADVAMAWIRSPS
jgi:putative acetyltransferase